MNLEKMLFDSKQAVLVLQGLREARMGDMGFGSFESSALHVIPL